MPSLGAAFTEVPGARSKEEFFAALRAGRARAAGGSGSYTRLTRDVLHIAAGTLRESPWLLPIAPIVAVIPIWTLANSLREAAFVRYWVRQLEAAGMLEPRPATAGGFWTAARPSEEAA